MKAAAEARHTADAKRRAGANGLRRGYALVATEHDVPAGLGRFEIGDRIGVGRLRGCHRAVDAQSGAAVLVRALPPSVVEDPARRAQLDARLARARDADPAHCVSICDWFDAPQGRVVVFEALEGETLADRLAQGGPLAAEQACRLAAAVARALADLHRLGRPYATLRPTNVWLDRTPPGPASAARLLPYPLSVDGFPLPSGREASEYLAPELRAAGARPSAAGDAYALGTLLCEALTGEPHPSADALEQLPARLAEWCRRLVDAVPSRRPTRLAEVAAGLAELAGTTSEATVHEVPREVSPDMTRLGPVGDDVASQPEQPQRNPTAAETAAQPANLALSVDVPIPAIDTGGGLENSPLAMRLVKRRRGDHTKRWLIVLAVATLAAVAAAIYVLAIYEPARRPADRPQDMSRPEGAPGVPAGEGDLTASDHAGQLDEGRGGPLWQAPVDGPPLSLAYGAPGVQFWLALRPAEIVAHPEGEKILAGLGPLGNLLSDELPKVAGTEPQNIEQVLIGLLDNDPDPYQAALVVRARAPVEPAQLVAAWGDAVQRSVGGQTVYDAPPWSYFIPPVDGGRTWVIAPSAVLDEIVVQGASAPPLRPEFESLLPKTAAARHLTLLFTTSFLFAGGKDLFAAEAAPLRGGLAWWLDREVKAGCLSLHLDANLFGELRVVSDASQPPRQVRDALVGRVDDLWHRVSGHLLSLTISSYSRPILERFPRMLELLAQSTRSAVADRQVVLRCYLPAVAAHNLAWSSYLTLAEQAAESPGEPRQAPAQDRSVAQRLREKTSLGFPRSTLEGALDLLGSAIGVPIEIVGADLQMEGITRNQSFALDARDKPAQDILDEIMRLANPDGKLVWVIRRSAASGRESLVITTRAAAQQRGEALGAPGD